MGFSLVAQMVEQFAGIAKVMGLNSFEACNCNALISQLLKLCI